MRMMRRQRSGSRLLTPAGPADDGPATLVDAGALYAGETVARIDGVRPAADLVRELAG
jgi:nitronate monooxygenase